MKITFKCEGANLSSYLKDDNFSLLTFRLKVIFLCISLPAVSVHDTKESEFSNFVNQKSFISSAFNCKTIHTKVILTLKLSVSVFEEKEEDRELLGKKVSH